MNDRMDDRAIPVLQSKLFYCRHRHHLTRQQLADRSGLSRYMIHRIETEKSQPSALAALRLAKALDMKVEELFEIKYLLRKEQAYRPTQAVRLAFRHLPK